MNEVIFTVTGMTCMGCVNSVKRLLSQQTGVNEVDVDLNAGKVRIAFDCQRIDQAALKQAIDDAGYRVTGS